MKTMVVREEMGARYKPSETSNAQPIKVHESSYKYIVEEAARADRTATGEVNLLVKLHQAIRAVFGTDDPEFIKREVERLRKKAGEGK